MDDELDRALEEEIDKALEGAILVSLDADWWNSESGSASLEAVLTAEEGEEDE